MEFSPLHHTAPRLELDLAYGVAEYEPLDSVTYSGKIVRMGFMAASSHGQGPLPMCDVRRPTPSAFEWYDEAL
ncbi:hypothetical protein V495_02891 [Pseudogymnoascus sp. VKM F-4514 (FW-929)]|nr:hypothetical protein V495_02891 [Pseudogymnoascus sp. VKM F-4514 (FW-929)]KFY62060.1 hypothetical protein V497_02599 [Pseudogymnoascus sp. VKM F-4516 (FW-969)]